jgi:drug/metabolite transporter (DMT)-like permease
LSEQRRRLVGIALMLGAVACFACLDASAKWVNRSIDPLQTAAVRYLGSFLLVGMFFNPVSRAGLLRTRNLWLQCGRALCLVAATICSFFALKYLRLTEATSITFSSPLIVALLAGPILGERIGGRRLAAVLIGFAGVLVITRPGLGGVHAAALLALGAACANALYSMATRLVAANDPSETTLFYTGLVG